jgi:hypothetical protein
MAQAEIVWQAPEFPHRPKGVSWYWITIIVATLLIGIAVWQQNFLFLFFVLVAEILILVWGSREPELLTFALNEDGLAVGNYKFYHLKDIQQFSMDDELHEEWDILMFYLPHRFQNSLRVHSPKSLHNDIQKLLRTRLKEIEPDHSAVDILEHLIGF